MRILSNVLKIQRTKKIKPSKPGSWCLLFGYPLTGQIHKLDINTCIAS